MYILNTFVKDDMSCCLNPQCKTKGLTRFGHIYYCLQVSLKQILLFSQHVFKYFASFVTKTLEKICEKKTRTHIYWNITITMHLYNHNNFETQHLVKWHNDWSRYGVAFVLLVMVAVFLAAASAAFFSFKHFLNTPNTCFFCPSDMEFLAVRLTNRYSSCRNLHLGMTKPWFSVALIWYTSIPRYPITSGSVYFLFLCSIPWKLHNQTIGQS